MTKNILYRGAEAEIHLATYMGRTVVQKQRVVKRYRIKELDSWLIASRTKEEAKLMTEARSYGVSVPIIYDVDLAGGIITMEYVAGQRIKDILNTMEHQTRKEICRNIGRNIARLHNHDIIHGDITTSNMILLQDRIYFIDFGLGCKNSELEAKGVDLHVLMEAFESTHSKYSSCFQDVFSGYSERYDGDASLVKLKIEDIVRRGRYR
ncbi:MAG: Kae1-associated serine/threonine protein kinase [Candidatus Thermoplasmatota archaeon]|nr:Kae1-associated serine/threonine protein kinase [Candidatus Thermoplasmatota archaeon]